MWPWQFLFLVWPLLPHLYNKKEMGLRGVNFLPAQVCQISVLSHTPGQPMAKNRFQPDSGHIKLGGKSRCPSQVPVHYPTLNSSCIRSSRILAALRSSISTFHLSARIRAFSLAKASRNFLVISASFCLLPRKQQQG